MFTSKTYDYVSTEYYMRMPMATFKNYLFVVRHWLKLSTTILFWCLNVLVGLFLDYLFELR